MAVPLISRENVIKRLREMGCEQVDVEFQDHTVWKTPWGFPFVVPHPPPEGMLSEFDFNTIVRQIDASKPSMH